MSEDTTIYLRNKKRPLLKYKNYPTREETKGLEEKEINKLIQEVEEYNDIAFESFGCMLFYLCTTPSRELDFLPYSKEPRILTKDLLNDVLDFYDEKINDYKKILIKDKENIEILERRIVKANLEIYDRIDSEINELKENIEYLETEIYNYQYYYNKFYFLKGIFGFSSNTENYELIYTKC